jgi:coenzyme F420-0:L-glutamate ligase
MNLIPIKTRILKEGENIFTFFLEYLKNAKSENIQDNTVLVISSKIVAVSQNKIVNIQNLEDFRKAVFAEADEILVDKNKFLLTVKNGVVIANAGIDQSNSKKGKIILWPENIQEFADKFTKKIKKVFNLKNFGVVVSDSRVTMRRRGTVGVAIAWSGFFGIKDERGTEDLFGNKLEVSTVNIADNLVSSAEILMGQAAESTPFVLIENLDKNLFTEIQQNHKSAEISKEEDLFLI